MPGVVPLSLHYGGRRETGRESPDTSRQKEEPQCEGTFQGRGEQRPGPSPPGTLTPAWPQISIPCWGLTRASHRKELG